MIVEGLDPFFQLERDFLLFTGKKMIHGRTAPINNPASCANAFFHEQVHACGKLSLVDIFPSAVQSIGWSNLSQITSSHSFTAS